MMHCTVCQRDPIEWLINEPESYYRHVMEEAHSILDKERRYVEKAKSNTKKRNKLWKKTLNKILRKL